jgi:MFS family permease
VLEKPMTIRALIALGIGQCVNWGVLYYSFAVLVAPLQGELGVATWVVTGAFSLALLVSAGMAPAVGRLGDRDRGALVMQVGGFAAAALLAAWTLVSGVVGLYVVWALLGLCMAATLYEPAFVIVARACDDPITRLRAIATVTLVGGLASTVFLPVTTFLVATLGWRGAVLALAVVLGGSTWSTRELVLRKLPARPVPDCGPSVDPLTRETSDARFFIVAGMFAFGSFASGAFTANLLPALGERGIAPSTAGILGGLMGVMQLPGRALLMNGMLSGSPTSLLALSLLCHAGGLGLIAFAPSLWSVALGTTVFALGAGLTTLVRPHLIQTMFSVERGGHLNGRIARQQQLARSAGPILVAWLAHMLSYATVFAVFAGTFVIGALVMLRARQLYGVLPFER